MRKNLLLTCLLTLIASFGFAKDTWPITLTTADGLPGARVVSNYMYKSRVYEFDTAVERLRFTVCSTNTVDSLTSGSFDGYSSGWGTGIPFFTLSELRIFDADGNQVEYVASSNAIQNGDGGGLAVLNDGKENNHFHTVYSRNTNDYPYEFHYVEVEFAEPISKFSFNWNTRSGYHKNLITYMGITPGTQYLPFPEQQFELGEKVTSVDELAAPGAVFVLRADAEEEYFNKHDETLGSYVPVNMFFHAPCGGTVTPSAADAVVLTADPEKENAYKVYWLNNGHYILNRECHNALEAEDRGDVDGNGSITRTLWLQYTKNVLNAASVEFAPSADKEGDFVLTMNDGGFIISFDGLGKMVLCENSEAGTGERSRPNTYYWSVYNASISGAAIVANLQAEIDEAEARIAAIGELDEAYSQGEYETLVEAVATAKALVADPNVAAADIITNTHSLNLATAAYAAAGLWVYVDSIQTISDMVDAEEIAVCEGPDWIEGAYGQGALENMQNVANDIQVVIEKCESLADVDAAIEVIYAAIAQFWASKVTGVTELPFRIGTVEDGLPGTHVGGSNGKGVWVWESPMWLLTEPTDALRLTVFKTHSGRSLNGKPFVCINEMEFYDQDGNKIPMTADNYSTPSVVPTDGAGLAGLCDGQWATDTSSHFHSQWGGDEDYDGSEYFYLDIELPYEVSGFKYVQYGRGNGYDDVPTDFVFSGAGETYFPEDIELPELYNTKVGDLITDASQITDDGLYTLVGLLNCSPEGDGTGYEKFYSSRLAYGTKVAAPCAFTITSAGEGTYYIRSLADSKYWSADIDDDGWGGTSVTEDIANAGKFFIVPNAEARAAAEKAEYPNTFVIYQYNDTVKRVNAAYNEANALEAGTAAPHPYVVVQDWGGNTGKFSIPDLTWNDFDGEGEWFIYHITMDNPYVFWLKNVYATASGFNLEAGPDPGFYSEASVGAFAAALAKAQVALDNEDNALAKEALLAIEATQNLVGGDVELNPMVPGVYVIESANANFLAQQGVKKAMVTYFNDFDDKGGASSMYTGWWTNAPEDIYNAPDRYKFEFIEADSAAIVLQWVADSIITAEQAKEAYFIRSVEVNKYIGNTEALDGDGKPERSYDINFTDAPELPYIVRSQGAYKFDLWNPMHANTSLHLEGNSGGGGDSGDLVYWTGTDVSSQWILRKIGAPITTGINSAVAEGDAVSVSYYTTAGVKVAAPVNGEVTIVKTVYANGVVKTTKTFVK